MAWVLPREPCAHRNPSTETPVATSGGRSTRRTSSSGSGKVGGGDGARFGGASGRDREGREEPIVRVPPKGVAAVKALITGIGGTPSRGRGCSRTTSVRVTRTFGWCSRRRSWERELPISSAMVFCWQRWDWPDMTGPDERLGLGGRPQCRTTRLQAFADPARRWRDRLPASLGLSGSRSIPSSSANGSARISSAAASPVMWKAINPACRTSGRRHLHGSRCAHCRCSGTSLRAGVLHVAGADPPSARCRADRGSTGFQIRTSACAAPGLRHRTPFTIDPMSRTWTSWAAGTGAVAMNAARSG
jgi:hypothetical protein